MVTAASTDGKRRSGLFETHTQEEDECNMDRRIGSSRLVRIETLL